MSDKRQLQIIPPARLPAEAHRPTSPVAVPPPRVNPGGIVESTLTRWEAERHARTINALTSRTRAEMALFDAQTEALSSYIKRARAFQELQELPEILANDEECRRTARMERFRQVQHQYQLAEMERATELTRREVALVDAEQQLKAQRDFGYGHHLLAWKKQGAEMLGVELDAAERRELLAQARRNKPGRVAALPSNGNDDDDALYEIRAQLLANGLDTRRIDDLLERRKTR